MQYRGTTARVFINGKWSPFMSIAEAARIEAAQFKSKGIAISLRERQSVSRFGRDSGHDLLKD